MCEVVNGPRHCHNSHYHPFVRQESLLHVTRDWMPQHVGEKWDMFSAECVDGTLGEQQEQRGFHWKMVKSSLRNEQKRKTIICCSLLNMLRLGTNILGVTNITTDPIWRSVPLMSKEGRKERKKWIICAENRLQCWGQCCCWRII